MPQYQAGQQQDVATRTDTAIAAGAGDHLPIGNYGSADYRSAMRFAVPAGWTGWTGIVSAYLKVYISDHQHVGPKNSAIFCSRMNVPVWTKDQGSQDCESGFSGGNTTQASDIASVSGSRVSFNSGSTANAAKTLNVTGIVNYYWQNNSPLVFVFDNDGSDQYTELWSLGKSGTTYDAELTINYEVQSVPSAPTPTAPTVGAVVGSDTPTFSWTHVDPQGDVQTAASIRVWDAAGTTQVGITRTVAGAANSLVWPVALPRGVTYQWDVATSDAAGYGLYSAKRAFTVKALPVVTIATVRKMVFANGQPRLVVEWTTDQPQSQYQVTAPGYDSGLHVGADQSQTLDTLALTSGTAVNVTVSVWNTDTPKLAGSAARSFTPRYGLTTHKRNLTATPVGWGNPSWLPASQPAGTDLVVEYGSSATDTATPTGNLWSRILSSVPLAQYLFYRVWFIPSATEGPTLDYINIPTDATATFVDKWGTTRNVPGLTGVWGVSGNEYVYGSRSLWAKVSGAGPFYCYAYSVSVRKDRSYILTGLMQSVGNSGACIELQDAAGAVLVGGEGYDAPPNSPIRTPVLAGDVPWFTPDGHDVHRYKSPVWKSTFDGDVYVVLKVGGASGAQAWFDAVKLEESTVATPWSPGAVGATVVDAGGVQVDGSGGGIFRYRGTAGGARDVVEGGASGLRFGGDTDLTSPSDGALSVDGVPISLNTHSHTPYTPPSIAGTSFPGSPTDGQQFLRTDLLLLFFWKASISRWLTVPQVVVLPATTASISALTNGYARGAVPMLWSGMTEVFVHRATASIYSNVAHSGSIYWSATFTRSKSDATTPSFAVLDTKAQTVANRWRNYGADIGSLFVMATDFLNVEVNMNIAGAAGVTYALPSILVSGAL